MDKQPLYHDSHDLEYRAPFGAVCVGQTVTLRMGILDGYYVSVPRVRIRWNDGEQTLVMEAVGRVYNGYHLVEAKFTPHKTGQFWISFAAENGVGHTITLCDDMEHFGGKASARYDGSEVPYLLTVYEKDFFVPEWFQDSVMYQIFPDRFYKSDREVCAKKPRMHENWDEEVAITPFGDQKHYMADDFFGGNLAGIEDKLDYLASLGVKILYLNPIFHAVSNHRYNTADYEQIDPTLGTKQSFIRLCKSAKARGIRIILDGVFSHTGHISRYFNADGSFNDLGAAQSKDSPYFSWYRFEDWPKKYQCWWGDESLPNVEEENPDYREYILGKDGIVRQWIRAGASGFRLDVADELPDLFLNELFAAVRAENPDAVVMGEVWENAAMKEAYGSLRPYLHGRQMHSVMNYPLRNILLEFFMNSCSASDVARAIMQLQEHYPKDVFHALMNMASTHDVPRALSLLSGMYDPGLPRPQLATLEPTQEQKAMGKRRLSLMMAALFFLPGNACVYYGDEAGMTGMRDPYCRRTFPWGREDQTLTAHVQNVSRIRASEEPLRGGDVRFLDAGRDVLCFVREKEGKKRIVLINRAPVTQNVILPLEDVVLTDVQSGEKVDAANVSAPAQWWRVLRAE